MTKLEKLFTYQIDGSRFLALHKYAYLADRPRLGKTIQSIHAYDTVQASRVLVICRAVARENWASECKRWGSLPRIIRVIKSRKTTLNPPPDSVTIVSYESVQAIIPKLRGRFDVVIVDEAHYIKSPVAVRTKNIMGNEGVIHRTDRMWFLSGTPTPNHFGELWTVLFPLGITKLNHDNFVTKFCNTLQTTYGLQILGTKTDPQSLAEMRALLSPILLRRTESEVQIQLPELIHSYQTVEAGEVDITAAGIFKEEIEKHGKERVLELIQEEMGLYNAIVGDTASHQLIETLKASAKSISTLRRYTALQKVGALCDLIEMELDNGDYEKVVVFCIHIACANIIRDRLIRFNPAIVTGATLDKAKAVNEFQNNPACKIFIGNINAAGTSISLSAANNIYFLEQSFVPGENDQAMSRCGGTNQKRTIYVKTCVMNNSVDQKVCTTLSRKSEQILQIYKTSQQFEELL